MVLAMKLLRCPYCSQPIWHDSDAELLAELAGEEYQPKCFADCYMLHEELSAEIWWRQPEWALGRRVDSTQMIETKHLYGRDRNYSLIPPDGWLQL